MPVTSGRSSCRRETSTLALAKVPLLAEHGDHKQAEEEELRQTEEKGHYELESDDEMLPALEKGVPHPPQYTFESPQEFARRHYEGTLKEHHYEKRTINRFNESDFMFDIWPICILQEEPTGDVATMDEQCPSEGLETCVNAPRRKMVLFLADCRAHGTKLPKEGESCSIKIHQYTPESCYQRTAEEPLYEGTASRVDNPCSIWRIDDQYWKECMAFTVTISVDAAEESEAALQPILAAEALNNDCTVIPRDPERRYGAIFELDLSTRTAVAQLDALKKLVGASAQNSGEMHLQHQAFRYLMDFKATKFVSLFDSFQHLPRSLQVSELRKSHLPENLKSMLSNFNQMQKEVWETSLAQCPHGICWIPGGPGGGKTHFNLVLSAAVRTQVLYLLDINHPLTDIANKMAKLIQDVYKDTAKPWWTIRCTSWRWKLRHASRTRLDDDRVNLEMLIRRQSDTSVDEEDGIPIRDQYRESQDKSGDLQIYNFATTFVKEVLAEGSATAQLSEKSDQPPKQALTLDAAAAAYYFAHRETKYTLLRDLYQRPGGHRSGFERLHEALVDKVYFDCLASAYFLAVTPVTASKYSGLYRPKVVIFDEAAHAHELSVMIAIAEFRPEVWIFTGDPRQTQPYVGSHRYEAEENVNQEVEQLRVSTMARACKHYGDLPSLYINHRAQAGLEQLGSELFYRSRMIAAPTARKGLPEPSDHLQRNYIMPLKTRKGSKKVSRLLVSLKHCCPAEQVQNSFYNPDHQAWVMDLVRKLVRDPEFLQISGKSKGTVLIMSPYRRSVTNYTKEIRTLAKESGLNGCLVEARTIDTAQGHEADLVILDLTKERASLHIRDANRLCVAITRARQAEIILMHPKMIQQLDISLRRAKDTDVDDLKLARMVKICKKTGQYVHGPANLDTTKKPSVKVSKTRSDFALQLNQGGGGLSFHKVPRRKPVPLPRM